MHPRSIALAASRISTLAIGIAVLVSASIGWCYWLRGPTATWPGPRITDALPLDELPGHSGISLIVFVAVLTLGGLLVGCLARMLRFDGFAIALSVGTGVGAWSYVASAISIYIVRQTSLDAAFDATRDLQAVYLAAALFALGAAVTARYRSGEQWLTRLVPASIGLLGVINLINAMIPRSPVDRVALGGYLAGPILPLTRTLEVIGGIVLMICARSLSRRSHRALVVASVAVFVLMVARVADNFNIVALVVDALVLAGLLARRRDFSFQGDPSTRAAILRRIVILIVADVAYGVVALAINREAAELPINFVLAFRSTLHALLIGAPSSTLSISGEFSEWFPWSLRAVVALGIVWSISSWFAPWRHELDDAADRRRRAARLVDAWGTDTLAPFTLRNDKAMFFYPTEPAADDTTTLIAYRVVRGVAIVSGDPIGPTDQSADAITAFRQLCSQRGWRFTLLGASDRLLDVYHSLGLHTLYHGDEAVIDTATFSLHGNQMKGTRQAANRVERKGYRAEISTAGDLTSTTRSELAALEWAWLAGERRKGFVMELDELFRLDGDGAVFVVGRGPDGQLAGFLELAVCRASSSLSLSAMPRESNTPNGLNAFLIVAAVQWAATHDYSALSLNFSPMARLFRQNDTRSGRNRIARRCVLAIKSTLNLQIDNLLMFNQHFLPRWQPRYIVIEQFRDLPRIIVAAMAAERYLPFAEVLRGRDRRVVHDDDRPSSTLRVP